MNYQISKREQEVLHLIAYENSTKEIAKELYISEHTVLSHRKNLLCKFSVKNTAGLIRKGFESGFLKIAICLFIVIPTFEITAQTIGFEIPVSISNDGLTSDSSAILDINSTNKGILIPRMTMAERDLVIKPATSLLIYQSDQNPGFYYNAGTAEAPDWQGLQQIIEGPQGIQGEQGIQGDQGPQGIQGPQGSTGIAGINCWDTNGNGEIDEGEDTNGDNILNSLDCIGATGETGPQGAQGPQGIQGEQGPQGETGSPGPQGIQGEQGPQGEASDLIDEDEDTNIALVESTVDTINAIIDGVVTLAATSDEWKINTPQVIQATSSESAPALLIDNTADNFAHIAFKNTGFSDNRFFISADPSTTGGAPADMRFFWKNVNSGNTINFFRMVSSGDPVIELKQNVEAEFDLSISGDLLLGDDGDISDGGEDRLEVGADWLPSTNELFDLGSALLSWEDLYADDIKSLVSLEYENGFSILQESQGIRINGDITLNKNNLFDLGSSGLGWANVFSNKVNMSSVDDLGGGNINVDANWEPTLDCQYNLGSSTRQWKTLYAKETVTGKLMLTTTETPPADSECTADNEGEIVIVKSGTGQNEGSQVVMVVCVDGSWLQI